MFGKAKLGWSGEQYELDMSMSVIEELDSEINVLQTALELDKGGIPKITLIAKVYSILLQFAGVNVTKEDVYTSIMKDPANSSDLVLAARYAINLCFPPKLDTSERTEKKQEG